MNQQLIELKEKLDNTYTTITALQFPWDDFYKWGAFTHTFISSTDLARIPKNLSNKISSIENFEPTDEESEIIASLINALNNSDLVLNHINYNGSDVAYQSISAYLLSMFSISQQINEMFSYEILMHKGLLPKNIIRKLELYHSNLAIIEEKTGNIEGKVDAINDAYDSAENLPTTLRALRETNDEITKLKQDSSESSKSILDALSTAKNDAIKLEAIKEQVEKLHSSVDEQASSYLSELKNKAEVYLEKCEEAFRTTTSKGLAGAFEDKAKKLNMSIRWWVCGLCVALLAGAFVGYTRLQALEIFLANPNTSGIKIFIQLLLSLLSVGAPLWFAWLATKQIGQRFRLAEDYEFKASVSKAYEGYRREAVQLDSDFSQRLFGNALTRLEEPPLRFVEESSHSSPLMEILSSDNFKKMIDHGGDSVDQLLAKLGLAKKIKQEDATSDSSKKEKAADEKDDS